MKQSGCHSINASFAVQGNLQQALDVCKQELESTQQELSVIAKKMPPAQASSNDEPEGMTLTGRVDQLLMDKQNLVSLRSHHNHSLVQAFHYVLV